METLTRLFGRSIRFAYDCFDRIVIRGYLSTLSRPENLVYFFRTGKQVECTLLEAEGVAFRMKDNAFVSVANPGALQAVAERIDPRIIQERLDYWTFMLGPKFAQHERDGMDLRRYYFLSQVEYAQNIIFKRTKGKHQVVLDQMDHGHHVLRAEWGSG